MNQTWYGLSPLIIALAQTSTVDTTDSCLAAGLKTPPNSFLLLRALLDNGADPGQGLPLEQFLTLRLLNSRKSKKSHNLCAEDVINSIENKLFVRQRAANGKTDQARWVYPIDVAAATGNINVCRLLLSRCVQRNIIQYVSLTNYTCISSWIKYSFVFFLTSHYGFQVASQCGQLFN
jgi:hypothetical protein